MVSLSISRSLASSAAALPEPALVAAVRAGDERAFETLFRAYHAPLCSFAYRYVRAPDVAEELVQEVFLHLWQQRSTWDVRGPLKTYLYTAVRNAAVSYLRHERVVARRAAETVALFDRPQPAADRALAAHEITIAVRAAVDRLPERCRLVFTLNREQGMSYAEIAATLGLSIKTVDTHMGRALKALRKYLGAHWP
jgi:RNA polymerase sigma-70 factor, ECF subfamily